MKPDRLKATGCREQRGATPDNRQRRDFAAKAARALVTSNDVIAIEDLPVKKMVRNRHLAKSINDAGWRAFRRWLEYLAKVYGKLVIAVPPEYTTQECSRCGKVVKKALSERIHVCPKCGLVLDRDHNAARVILERGLRQLGLQENYRGASREVTLGETEASTGNGQPVSASAVAEPRIPRH